MDSYIHTYVSKAAWTLTSERCGKLTHSCNETSQCARTIRVGEKRSHPSAEDQQHSSMPDHSGKSASHRRSKALKVSSIFPPQTILWRPGPLKRSPQRRSLAHGDPHVFGPQSEESMLFRFSPHKVYLEIVVGVHPLIQHAKLVKWFKYFITLFSFVKPTPVKILRRKFCFAKQECGGRGSSWRLTDVGWVVCIPHCVWDVIKGIIRHAHYSDRNYPRKLKKLHRIEPEAVSCSSRQELNTMGLAKYIRYSKCNYGSHNESDFCPIAKVSRLTDSGLSTGFNSRCVHSTC